MDKIVFFKVVFFYKGVLELGIGNFNVGIRIKICWYSEIELEK